VIPVGNSIWYSSENSIFRVSDDHKISNIPNSHTLTCERLTSNSWAVFSSGLDKLLCRFEEEKETQKATLPTKPLSLTCDENHVYVLTLQSEMIIIDARTLATKSSNKLKFDATAMEICGS
jgi:hypothetical protein